MANTASSRGRSSGASRDVACSITKGKGMRRSLTADLHRHRVVFQQQLDLLAVVVGEQVGARQGGAIGAGIGQAAIGGAAVGQQIVDADGDAEIG